MSNVQARLAQKKAPLRLASEAAKCLLSQSWQNMTCWRQYDKRIANMRREIEGGPEVASAVQPSPRSLLRGNPIGSVFSSPT